MAHMSGDENLIRAYNESRDIHASTAAEIYGVDIADVTDEMRRNAKAVNFGIIYGISDFGLAQNLSIRVADAKKYIERYFRTYPKVKEFMDGQVEFAKEHGFVRTLFNRIRLMPELSSSNYAVREFGKRAAMNFPLQGTAADIIKIAMAKILKALLPKVSLNKALFIKGKIKIRPTVAALDKVAIKRKYILLERKWEKLLSCI